MPNSVVFRQPFRKRGQSWLVPSHDPPLADVMGSGGVVVGGAATVYTSELLANVTGSGGLLLGGSATVFHGVQVGSIVGAGGILLGGTGSGRFIHGPQVPSNIVVEWDLDNDGDFDGAVEDITSLVLSLETFTGRDWPSLLTGRAGPGRMTLTLNNDDDRFNYFNASSPLATAPYSLRTGRKIRVRTVEATTPDPVLLAKDRFRRADGSLGDEELGLAWTDVFTDPLAIVTGQAAATDDNSVHGAAMDLGTDDYYVQTQITTLDPGANVVGLIYRYADSNDYSLLVVDVDAQQLQMRDVVSGVASTVSSTTMEVYGGVTIGVHVSGDVATAYLEGVETLEAAAINSGAAEVGLYALWGSGAATPSFGNFYAWDGLPAQVAGVLWTGDVSELTTSVEPGPRKQARVTGAGWLSKLATQKVSPPTSISGRRTGLLVGNVLANATLLHPPGPIAAGDITTGTFALADASAMETTRRAEEVEYGFLYETQEGHLSFEARSARASRPSVAIFSDAPGGKYGYHELQPYDARREVFNRVVGGVSAWAPGDEATLFTDPGPYQLASGGTQTLQASATQGQVIWTGHTRKVAIPDSAPSTPTITTQTGTGSSADVDMPATVNAGDLLLIIGNVDGPQAALPAAGWTQLVAGYGYWAKAADGTEGGDTISMASFEDAWIVQVWRITSWYGSLDGVAMSSGWGQYNRDPDSTALSPSWGTLPTLYISAYTGETELAFTQIAVPSGYTAGALTEAAGTRNYMVSTAYLQRTGVASEDPGSFTINNSRSSELYSAAWTLAIRGGFGAPTTLTEAVPAGAGGAFTIGYHAPLGGSSQVHYDIQVTGTPLVQGDPVVVQADDFVSQDEHNAIRTYTNSAHLFRTITDAQEYADLVLATHADDRPILSLSFYATKSGAYRAQAYQRRVGDRITLVANHTTGMGVDQDFFIESIGHKWSHGVRLWETTWELSPA